MKQVIIIALTALIANVLMAKLNKFTKQGA